MGLGAGETQEYALTVAPAALANCTAKILTPPVPCVITISPGISGLRPYRAFQAVRAAHESVDASSQFKDGGMSTRPFSL